MSGEFKQRASESGKSSQTERQERNKEQGKQKRASGGGGSDGDDVVGVECECVLGGTVCQTEVTTRH